MRPLACVVVLLASVLGSRGTVLAPSPADANSPVAQGQASSPPEPMFAPGPVTLPTVQRWHASAPDMRLAFHLLERMKVEGAWREIIELPNHKFFIGAQFHPEFNSRLVCGKVSYKFADEKEEMHRGREMEAMVRMLSQYKSLCGTRKVQVRVHYLARDVILAGVVNLINMLKIKRIIIGSRNMSKQAVLRKCHQIWVVLNGKHISTSNDHLEHTGSIGYGGSPEFLASIHELGDESDGYTTPPSDLVDEIMDEDGVIQMDGTEQLATEAETLDEQGIEESNAYEEVEYFSEEGADQSDEIQSVRNNTEKAEKLMKQIDKLQRKLKELQDKGHKHEESILSPRQKVASLKEKTLSKPRYPELQIPEHIAQLSMSQIEKATNNFYSRNLIGEGGYGPVYKGKLGGMPVAIKLLRPHDKQGFPEYQQEVVMLSRIEHPHIVRLIGVCPESCGLVYEHLPNGTLLDRLSKGLAWKDRVRILAEQRSALAFLHDRRPHAIIHADLKLTNILLGAGNVSRLGDFGTARMVHMKPLEEETICRRTNPMGTTGYMDPVFFMTGELTTESDVYAFGVVILQVLTGLLDLNIDEQVREAVKIGRRAQRVGRVSRELAGGAGRAPAPAGAEVLQPGAEAAASHHVRCRLEIAGHPAGHGNGGR